MKNLIFFILTFSFPSLVWPACVATDVNKQWRLFYSASSFIQNRHFLAVTSGNISPSTGGWAEWINDGPANLYNIGSGGKLAVNATCFVTGTWPGKAGTNTYTFSIREAKMDQNKNMVVGVFQRRTTNTQQQSVFTMIRN